MSRGRGATGGVDYVRPARSPRLTEKQARILALIRHRDEVTIHLVSAWSGLSLTQVTAAVVVLMEQERVYVDGDRIIRPGRPPKHHGS